MANNPVPVLSLSEAEASKHVLDALRDIEKQVCSSPKAALPVNISWTVIFEFISIAQKILTNPAVQAVLTMVAPQLAQKLVQLEQQVMTALQDIKDWLNNIVPTPPASHP